MDAPPAPILSRMRTERSLRIIGVIAWLVAGSTSFPRLPRDPHALAWVAAFASFGVLLWVGSDRRAQRARRVACLVGQAALATVLGWLGMPHFEGALLALVAAQVPMALPLWASVPWALAQLVPLWLVVVPNYDRVEVAKSLSSYLGFSAFAIALVHLFEAERRARVALVRSEERVHIARELHDVLGHELVALTIQLDLARRTAEGKARAPLEEAHGIAQGTLAQVRKVVHEMQQGTRDLKAALETLARKVPKLAVTLDYAEGLAVSDPACAHVALRCVQEAVTNALKHARANRIEIRVARDEGDLVVTVKDDGELAGDVRPGHGLSGMRERVEELGGRLDVTSAKGEGTMVCARLPMENAS